MRNQPEVGAVAGAVVILLVWGLKAFTGVEMSAEAQASLSIIAMWAVYRFTNKRRRY
jgi:hypothetical protein